MFGNNIPFNSLCLPCLYAAALLTYLTQHEGFKVVVGLSCSFLDLVRGALRLLIASVSVPVGCSESDVGFLVRRVGTWRSCLLVAVCVACRGVTGRVLMLRVMVYILDIAYWIGERSAKKKKAKTRIRTWNCPSPQDPTPFVVTIPSQGKIRLCH